MVTDQRSDLMVMGALLLTGIPKAPFARLLVSRMGRIARLKVKE